MFDVRRSMFDVLLSFVCNLKFRILFLLFHCSTAQLSREASPTLRAPSTLWRELARFCRKIVFLRRAEKHLSPCVTRSKNFFYFFRNWPKALARFCLALVSYICIIHVYHTTVSYKCKNLPRLTLFDSISLSACLSSTQA
jgi:hypothetical protein